MIIINFLVIFMNLCTTIGIFGVKLGTQFNNFQTYSIIIVNYKDFQLVFGRFLISSWMEKVTSRAKARASSARTHHYLLYNAWFTAKSYVPTPWTGLDWIRKPCVCVWAFLSVLIVPILLNHVSQYNKCTLIQTLQLVFHLNWIEMINCADTFFWVLTSI